ncbi:RING-H2 finger protein ATL66 [Mercurialis annua]|uniref:RING-H2 finger protein ATL66 n=1 Tax=Mercurialis annua TaxID=3986 RepID=UPI00215EE742|nr:RING-H2 finger protein ATL66 [Mercurialis annua]
MSSQDSQPFHWHFSTELNHNDLEIHGRTLFFIVILLALVILITLLSLYARWVCRYQQHHIPSSNPLSHTLAPSQRGLGLDQTMIKAIPISLHQSSSSSSSLSECCICLGVFEEGDKVKVLPECNHFFHCECVDKWLVTHSSCPLCRALILCCDTV